MRGCLTQQHDRADGINQFNNLRVSMTSLPRVAFVVPYTAHGWSLLGRRFLRLLLTFAGRYVGNVQHPEIRRVSFQRRHILDSKVS